MSDDDLATRHRAAIEVLATDPDHAAAWHELADIACQRGEFASAADYLSRVTALEPQISAGHFDLGRVLVQLGRLDAAEGCFRRAIGLEPTDAAAWCKLGGVQLAAGRVDEAIVSLEHSLSLNADQPEAANALGVARQQQGALATAVACYERAMAIAPDWAEPHFNLGTVRRRQGHFQEAIVCFRGALIREPDHWAAWVNLGNAMKTIGDLPASITCYQKALDIAPRNAVVLSNLGNALKDAQRLDEAVACQQQAVREKPELAEAHSNLGTTLRTLGKIDGAIACYRQAIQVRPSFAAAHSNLIYSLYFSSAYDAPAICAAHREFDERHAARLTQQAPVHFNDRTPSRRLKIGYFSPHFREHVLALFLTPLWEALDRKQYAIHAYSDVTRPDEHTQRLRACAAVWREVAGLSDEQLAQQVRADGIDILIDLTMHMESGRPLLFARKPAPVQACWFAYPGTTGLSAIDYRLTDSYMDPPGMFMDCYTEQTLRLPDAFWCYNPLTSGPEEGPLPAVRNGYLTFGSLNSFSKMNDGVLALWGQVMSAVENSRLILLAPVGSAREWVAGNLATHGVTADRLTFADRLPRADYLALYQQIDIAIDTLPANGHTTSLDALWMGVPVVTLVGHTAIGRGGVSILQNLGMPELIARTTAEYVSTVCALAANLPQLSELRGSLRRQLEQSPLMDAQRFARGMEAAYRQMWRSWCLADRT